MTKQKISKELKYHVSVQSELNKTPSQQDNFIKLVDQILSDPRTWSVKFIRVGDPLKADFEINLTPPKFIKDHCGFSGLSCANLVDKKIYINNHRWARGSKQFKGPLPVYRNYIINHEVGHILGKTHPPVILLQQCKKGAKAPVMAQQTLGTGKCKINGWPLKREL